MLDVDLDAVLDAFIAKPTLKTATLQLTMLTQLKVVANVLGSPNCSITELDIKFRFNRINPDMGQLKHEQLTQTLVNSLQRSTSISALGLWVWEEQRNFIWPFVSNLLCDTSNIDATIQSNHTLESFSMKETRSDSRKGSSEPQP
jgi:hypothetical protein